MIKRILVGLAGPNYLPASIDYAVDLAKQHDAQLTGLTVLNPRIVPAQPTGPKVPSLAQTREQREIAANAQVEEAEAAFVAACEKAGIRRSIVKESGDLFEALVSSSRYHDLVVCGLRSVFAYDALAGSPEAMFLRLIRAGVRPLIAVPKEHQAVTRVVVAYHGSMESAKAMKAFVQMHLWPDAELKIVAFHQREPDPDLQHALQSAEAYCRAHGYAASHQAIPGNPSGLHQAAAMWGAHMIVMGNSGKNALLREVLQDTLLTTLRDTQIPLFLSQ